MRIDQFLKKILIFKQRTEARLMCLRNLVMVNGRYSKPSKVIRPGDSIEIETAHGVRRIKVLKIPDGNVRKDEINLYYEELT
jgi:ribosomal 50S subunit-recycling heat shock protein